MTQPRPLCLLDDDVNDVVIGDYKVLRKIGEGSYGIVAKVQHQPTGTVYAMKAVLLGDREATLLQHLEYPDHHPNIISLLEVPQVGDSTYQYLVMELMRGGDLEQVLESSDKVDRGEGVPKRKGFPEEIVRRWMRQLVSALQHCRRANVVHRDIKPANLLLDAERRNLKLADFGLGNTQAPGRYLISALGTLRYAAPELLREKEEPVTPYNGFSVDVWSCGVIMYELLVGSRPFDDPQQSVVWNKIRANVRKSWPKTYAISEEAKHLVGCMLELDPRNRIDVGRILEHPWFSASPGSEE